MNPQQIVNRPQTTVILAMSADGKISDELRSPASFSSEQDKLHLEKQIAQMDGILFGTGTLNSHQATFIITNTELLQTRKQQKKPPQPVQIVVSASGKINPNLHFFQQPVSRWLLTTNQGQELSKTTQGFEKIIIAENHFYTIDLIKAFKQFQELGLKRLGVLGGGQLVSSLLKENLIDEFCLTICPLILAGKNSPTPADGEGFLSCLAPRLKLLEVKAVGQEVFLHYMKASEQPPVDDSVNAVSLTPTITAVQPAVVLAATPLSQSQAVASSVAPSISAPSTHTINPQTPAMTQSASNFVTASQAPSELPDSQLVYALGTLGYDFGTEARRDSFKQLMPANIIGEITVPANPYDPRQMVDYLAASPSESTPLIWTLNIELTAIYAIEPQGAFARDTYIVLQELLAGQIQAESSEEYVERVSIPGVLTGRTIKLFSGQVVPLLAPQNPRGMYGWKINTLVSAAIETVQTTVGDADEEAIRRTLGSFLNRIYYDLRNLGTTSQDRALNFAATNAFQAASTFAEAVATGMELDSITVEKSPFCRLDSDCWDVKLKFFDPENSRRAKKVFRFTIDVRDLIPVTLGDVRTWSSPY
ncbi:MULTISPECIES: PatA/PatG family cyanobactin maturation protease [unclassified Nostoc]|uniref:PatA/PatG family cyanobactin maturation protease n=1 Tax=unclassified Nostoc TaxID=2593658 RepID=UPI000B95A209|nr:PatA/PatG family cyanobactin maturation protease [Nostoc sp. 'Peltigera membranacea cyanobiont' 232]OYE00509.1 hypothetical protein CDG79_34815 [Nostoc sp. 'Peltigera membranacea cyanobiont' 232]